MFCIHGYRECDGCMDCYEPACHDTCPFYQMRKAKNEKINNERRRQNEIRNGFIEGIMKVKRRASK